MNLVGKIFVVLILVMSVVFSVMVMVVYATHVNWRDAVQNPKTGYLVKLQKETAEKTVLDEKLKRIESEFVAERKAMRDQLAAQKAKLSDVTTVKDEQGKQLEDVTQRERKTIATLKVTQDALDRAEKEVRGLREEILAARKAQIEKSAEVSRLNDQLTQRVYEFETLKSRAATLAKDLTDAKTVLRKHGFPERPEADSDTPPLVNGHVTAVREGLIQISVGSDSGLRKGHRLEVFRGGTYLGRVVITAVNPHDAVCQVLPETKQGAIQTGDNVTTKIN